MEFDVVAGKFLKAYNIPVNQHFLSKRLISHPDYPSLTSLTDTLTELKIDHLVIRADKSKADQLFYPLLMHTINGEKKSFKIIRSYEEFKKGKDDFIKIWDGTVLMIDKNSIIKNNAYQTIAKHAGNYCKITLSVAVAAGVIFLTAFTINFNLTTFLISLLCIAGSFICTLIILKNFGKRNIIIDKLCKADDSGGCNNVLQSKASKLFANISLGDIGLIYFTSIFLFLLIGQICQPVINSVQLLIVPAALAFTGTFFSVWYQWRVVKSWCKICLIVVIILWFQAIVLSLTASSIIKSYNNFISMHFLPTYLLFILSFLIITSAWFYLKRLYLKVDEFDRKEIETLKWKRDPEVFFGFLHQQRQIKDNYFENDIVLGLKNAPVQFIVVCNPYCAPCARTHFELDDLLKIYPALIGITVRFAVNTMDEKDIRRIAVEHILNACFSVKSKQAILHDWFENMDLEIWKKKYNDISHTDNSQRILKQHMDWAKENSITYTPAIFFNGYELPKQYTLADVKLLIPSISETK